MTHVVPRNNQREPQPAMPRQRSEGRRRGKPTRAGQEDRRFIRKESSEDRDEIRFGFSEGKNSSEAQKNGGKSSRRPEGSADYSGIRDSQPPSALLPQGIFAKQLRSTVEQVIRGRNGRTSTWTILHLQM